MTDQNHESMKTLISGLSITRYHGLLKTKLDDTERKEIETLLREEELALKREIFGLVLAKAGMHS
jgi:hypothetical protein